MGEWRGSPVTATSVGMFSSSGIWYLDYNNDGSWLNATTDAQDSSFGDPASLPVAGLWASEMYNLDTEYILNKNLSAPGQTWETTTAVVPPNSGTQKASCVTGRLS